MNLVVCVGRLVRDPQISANGNTKVARFNIAVQQNFKGSDGKYGADFPSCVAFGKTAEFVEKYFTKGSQIGVTGRISTGSYTNKDGVKVYTTDIAVEKVEFVGSKTEKSDVPVAKDDGFMNIPDKVDEVPFG